MTEGKPTADVLFVSGDLFVGSRVRGAVEAGGWTADVAGSGASAVERLQSGTAYALALVDLETPGLQIADLMAARGGDAPPVVAYGPHVHESLLEAARTAKCNQVLTRGQFDATLPRLLQHYLSPGDER